MSSRTTERNTIRLADGTYSLGSGIVIGSGVHATIVGSRGAIVEFNGVGTAAEVTMGNKLSLRGFTLHRGISCENATLEAKSLAFNTPGVDTRAWIAMSGCTATMTDCVLSDSTDNGVTISGGTVDVTSTTIERSARHGVDASSATVNVKSSTITRSAQNGINASGGRLVLQRSIVSANRLGGVRSIGGGFDIVNNFVFRNGDSGLSTFGGMHLDTDDTTSRLAHNSVYTNDCDFNFMPPLSGGIYCRVGSPTSFPNNLVFNNFRGNQTQINAQTGGNCGVGGFVTTGAFFGCKQVAPGELDLCRIVPGTTDVIDKGTPTGVMEDFGGQPRSDGKPDMGADELDP